MDTIDYGTIWVCVCCMLSHANGECCGDDDAHTPARDARGRFTGDTVWGDGYPLSRVRPPFMIAMGMGREEHECIEHDEDSPECDAGTCECERPDECECERQTYSTSQCDGCGSYLHGERHAMWLHKVKRPRRKRQTAAQAPQTAPSAPDTQDAPSVPQTAAQDLTTVPGVLRACYSAYLGKEL